MVVVMSRFSCWRFCLACLACMQQYIWMYLGRRHVTFSGVVVDAGGGADGRKNNSKSLVGLLWFIFCWHCVVLLVLLR
jgi:hypothetical protein